jgi:hypothetical protein
LSGLWILVSARSPVLTSRFIDSAHEARQSEPYLPPVSSSSRVGLPLRLFCLLSSLRRGGLCSFWPLVVSALSCFLRGVVLQRVSTGSCGVLFKLCVSFAVFSPCCLNRKCEPGIPGLTHQVSSLLQVLVCESLQGDAGIALQSLDQMTQGFVVQIVLPR